MSDKLPSDDTQDAEIIRLIKDCERAEAAEAKLAERDRFHAADVAVKAAESERDALREENARLQERNKRQAKVIENCPRCMYEILGPELEEDEPK